MCLVVYVSIINTWFISAISWPSCFWCVAEKKNWTPKRRRSSTNNHPSSPSTPSSTVSTSTPKTPAGSSSSRLTVPLSERQQMALILQMSSAENNQGTVDAPSLCGIACVESMWKICVGLLGFVAVHALGYAFRDGMDKGGAALVIEKIGWFWFYSTFIITISVAII